jgi:hypothetical protein
MSLISKLKKLLRLSTRAPDDDDDENEIIKKIAKKIKKNKKNNISISEEDNQSSDRGGLITTNNNISISQQNNQSMAIFNYGVGGNETKVDANEAIQEIQENKTLLVSKLTHNDPVNPEIITGLKTVEDVFRYFNPALNIEQETIDGQTIREDFRFSTLSDFAPKNITQQSPYLKNMSLQQEQYNRIIRQLKSNKILRSMLENEQTKDAFINALKAVAEELEATKE